MNYYKTIEKYLKPNSKTYFGDPYIWFVNQGHIPLLDNYSELYEEFLKEITNKSFLEKGKYFWFDEGRLINCNNSQIIAGNSIFLNRDEFFKEVRNFKINYLLS